MPWPTTFAKLSAGNQLLALFDAMFTQIAQMVAVPCTAAGTNAITLTPIGNAPAFTSYQNFTAARFVATSNSTAAVTATFAGLTALNVYNGDMLTQAGNGSITSGQEYVLIFVQSLNAGAGGFVLEQASVPATAGFIPVPANLISGVTYTTPLQGGRLPLYLHVRMIAGGGGGGSNNSGTGGGAGGTTSFDSWTALGGSGGQPCPGFGSPGPGGAGGSGGVNGSGVLRRRLAGARGNDGISNAGGPTPRWPGGLGGVGPFGGQGRGVAAGNGGASIANTGCGGAGGGDNGVECGGGGGCGEYVEFFISPPAASYPIAIGAAGAASTGGITSNGAAGAAGRIIVLAHWQ